MEQYIVAPSYGVVLMANEFRTIIFIPYREDHHLFAPISGKIMELKFTKGDFIRNIYEVQIHKKGRMTTTIQGDIIITFWAEIGFPYRPRRLRMDKNMGDTVFQGQKIGEILFGSLTETRYPIGIDIISLVSQYQKIIGGKTRIASFL